MRNLCMPAVFDDFRAHVKEGELREALDELRTLLSGQLLTTKTGSKFREFDREAILQLSRLGRLEKKQRRGISDAASADLAFAQITYAILDLIDEVERASELRMLPVRRQPIDVSPIPDFDLEKIWGRNTLKSLSWLHEGLKRAKSVCRVVSPVGLGTGFVLGAGILITNNHVLESAEQAAATSIEFNFEEDANGNICPVSSYRLDPSSQFTTNEQLDCTAVKIAEASQAVSLSNWGTLTIAQSKHVEVGDHVTIIQHPRGGVKQVGLTANHVVNIFDSRLQYMTDTLPGSSGAPVFNDDWQVIAIHHAGGNLMKNNRGERIFANEGILMHEVLRLPQFGFVVT
jgi:V8-like Glu-specific endopeptidase